MAEHRAQPNTDVEDEDDVLDSRFQVLLWRGLRRVARAQKYTLWALAGVLLAVFFTVYTAVHGTDATTSNTRDLKGQVSVLKQQNATLRKQVSSLRAQVVQNHKDTLTNRQNGFSNRAVSCQTLKLLSLSAWRQAQECQNIPTPAP